MFIFFSRKKPKSKNSRLIKRLEFLLFLIFILYFSALTFPQPLFAKQIDFQNIRIFVNDSAEQDKVQSVLAEAMHIVESSEIFDKNFQINIFICDSFLRYKFFSLFRPNSYAVSSVYINNIYVAMADFNLDLSYRNSYERNVTNLGKALAHELMHQYIRNQFGNFKNYLNPSWVNEGYSEFVARGPSMDLVNEIKQFDGKTTIENISPAYVKYRLLISYLIQIKHYSFLEIVNSKIDPITIEKEMINWAINI